MTSVALFSKQKKLVLEATHLAIRHDYLTIPRYCQILGFYPGDFSVIFLGNTSSLRYGKAAFYNMGTLW